MLEKFVESYISKYEQRKELITYLVKLIEVNESLLNNDQFCKAVIVFSNELSEIDLELMSREGTPVERFMDIVIECENKFSLDLEDLEEFEIDENI